jgi:signal peptide peptidase SppA
MYRVLQAFYATAWALDPTIHALMCQVLDRWATGVRLGADEIAAAVGSAPQGPAAIQARREAASQASGGVAVIPVYGVLTHRAYAAANVSTPLTSTEALAEQFRAAIANSDVGSIVLDVDSPGGSVNGVQELGEVILQARGTKPVIAVANATAASGAYWIASQADEIVVTPSGAVGSIGVILQHVDASAAYEKVGVRKTIITAGRYKAEGADTGPLSDEASMYLQGLVDTHYTAFTKAVAKGRGAPIDTVRGPAYGEGRMRLAKAAVDSGMADRVDTLDNVIAKLARAPRRAAAMSASAAAARIAIIEAGNPHH